MLGNLFKKSCYRGIILILPFFIFACGKNESKTKSERLKEGFELIDAGNYDAAINELNSLLQEDPSDRNRVALASAYAGRAGIILKNYAPFLETFKSDYTAPETQNLPPDVSKISLLLNQVPDENLKIRWQEAIRIWPTLYDRFQKLPDIQAPGKSDLIQAETILQPTEMKSARLYRVFLSSIIIKYDLKKIPSWQAPDLDEHQFASLSLAGKIQVLKCKTNFVQIIKKLPPIMDRFAEGSLDFNYLNSTDTSFTQFKNSSNSISVMKDAQKWKKQIQDFIKILGGMTACN